MANVRPYATETPNSSFQVGDAHRSRLYFARIRCLRVGALERRNYFRNCRRPCVAARCAMDRIRSPTSFVGKAAPSKGQLKAKANQAIGGTAARFIGNHLARYVPTWCRRHLASRCSSSIGAQVVRYRVQFCFTNVASVFFAPASISLSSLRRRFNEQVQH